MANWRRKLSKPIYLADGTILVTLRDAANWIIDHQPSGSETAIERLIDAAEKDGSVDTAEAAVRHALFTKTISSGPNISVRSRLRSGRWPIPPSPSIHAAVSPGKLRRRW